MVASSRFASSASSPFFVIHRTNFARLLAIPRPRRTRALAVFTILSSHADGATGETFVSYLRIADEAGMARSSAIAAIKDLHAADLVTVEERYDPQGDRATNRYHLAVLPPVAVVNHGGRADGRGVVRSADPIENPDERESWDEQFEISNDPTGDENLREIRGMPPPPRPVPDPDPDRDAARDADRAWLLPFVRDFARELGDRAPLASSLTRAANLYRAARIDHEAFIELLYAARATTRGRARVAKRMAYLFRVIEDRIARLVPDDGYPRAVDGGYGTADFAGNKEAALDRPPARHRWSVDAGADDRPCANGSSLR